MHSKADQLELIGLMAANELAVGEIYEVCEKRYPPRAKLFKKLAGARVRVDDLDGLLLITYRRTTVREINLRTHATIPVLLPGPQL